MQQHNNTPNYETRITNLEQRVQKLEILLPKNRSNEKIGMNTGTSQGQEVDLDFDLDIRAFVKKYVAGAGKNKKSGAQKFVLLLAYMPQGDISKDIEVKNIKKEWNKMVSKELLAMSFDSKTATRAKTDGWVRSRKHGSYHLTKDWKTVL